MCSITGYIGKIETREQIMTVMRLMLFGQTRGREGFGLLIVKDDKIRTIKYHSSFTKYIKSRKRFNNLVKMLRGATLFLGHTRFPTGNAPSTKIKNLHPFSSTNFMMSHNGSFSTYELKELQKNIRYKLPKKIDTDSYHLVCAIQKVYDKERDVFASVRKSLECVSSFAVWLYDKKNKKVFLFRDMQPTHYYRKEGKFFAFASTDDILKNAFDNKEIETMETKPYRLYEIKDNKILVYKDEIKKPTAYGGVYNEWYGQSEIERDLDEQENNWFLKYFADTWYEDKLEEVCETAGLEWIMKYEPSDNDSKISRFTGVEIFLRGRKMSSVLGDMVSSGYKFPLFFETHAKLAEFLDTAHNMRWTQIDGMWGAGRGQTKRYFNDKRKG